MTTSRRTIELWVVAGLFVAGAAISFGAIKAFRAAGNQPQFYQQNFGPAVMMACGHGFTAPSFQSSPPSLHQFLALQRDRFDCADLPPSLALEPVSWNGTWYYLYATAAAVWRVTGVAWTALDRLAAVFGAIVLVAYYGLFRLVANRWIAALVALGLTLSPANLLQLPMLRDYSKAPFALVSVLLLAWLVMRPVPRPTTFLMAAAFGAVVGLGYGFRSDLLIMVPFGLGVIALLLPGRLRDDWTRNLLAVGIAAASFALVAWPALRGLQTGGCQFHYALLGLTSPLTREMSVEPSIYGFGDHFLDTFVDLKVGDYGHRMMGLPVPNLCAPDYDTASGELFFRMAASFPADLAVHAYGAVLTILREGLVIPPIGDQLGSTTLLPRLSGLAYRITDAVGVVAPLVTLVAAALAWVAAPRLGIAVTAFVLFLAGYPAIEFEARHWFHLRFLPWFAGLAVGAALMRHPPSRWQPADVRRVAIVAVSLVAGLGAALMVLRLPQQRAVASLLERYLAAPVEALPVAVQSSVAAVDWQPEDYAPPPGHRSSDLLVVTIESAGCAPAGQLDVRIRYEADLPTHDLSTTVAVARAQPGGAASQLFFPIFSQGHLDHTYLRFAALETPGRQADCISRVARVTDRTALPLWLQMQAPPDWRERSLYQTLRTPRLLRFLR